MTDRQDLQETRQIAGRVAARSQIKDVRLLQTTAKIIRYPGAEPDLSYSLDVTTDVAYHDGDDAFVVRCAYSLKIVEIAEDADDPADVAELSFQHAGLFLLDRLDDDEALKSEEFEAFAKTTGQFALYPFARQYIYDVTGRLALPPLTIELLYLPFAPKAKPS